MKSNRITVSEEAIINKIMLIRNEKVMLDADLAELFGVTIQRLNEHVERNLSRFPPDFMFQLTPEEKSEVITVCSHLSNLKSSSALHYAFTEYGAIMLASVLDTQQSIAVNIQYVRVFVKMREILVTSKVLLQRLQELEDETTGQDEQIEKLYGFIKSFLEA